MTILTLLLCALAFALSCGARGGEERSANAPKPAVAAVDAPAPAAAQIPQSKTCALISAEDFKEVQGEAPAAAQGSEHAAGPLSMSQCFFRLPTFDKSVNLEVVRAAAGADAGALKDYWRKRFRPEAVEARAQERELKAEAERQREEELKREREAGQVREGGRRQKRNRESEDWRPQPVPGLGEEAYLTGNDTNTTLFVLKGDAVLRLTLGGTETRADKLKKAAALAGKVLKRL
ncbi:MAG: hypothetical protein ABW208_01820 [Pyrinomonadaceae bacterium]